MIKVKPPPFFDYDINDHQQGEIIVSKIILPNYIICNNNRPERPEAEFNQQLFEYMCV